MKCSEYAQLVSQSQDTPVRWRTKLRMLMHHVICVYCRRFAAQLGQIRNLLQAPPDDRPMPRAMREQLAQNLQENSHD